MAWRVEGCRVKRAAASRVNRVVQGRTDLTFNVFPERVLARIAFMHPDPPNARPRPVCRPLYSRLRLRRAPLAYLTRSASIKERHTPSSASPWVTTHAHGFAALLTAIARMILILQRLMSGLGSEIDSEPPTRARRWMRGVDGQRDAIVVLTRCRRLSDAFVCGGGVGGRESEAGRVSE